MRPRHNKYATRTVSRELFRDFKPVDFAGNKTFQLSELAEMLEKHALHQLSDNDFGAEIALDYAIAFLRQVNYCAIARQLLEGEQ